MRLKIIFIVVFTFLVAAKTYSQADIESDVTNPPDPSKKERSDDPALVWKEISAKALTAVKNIKELLTDVPDQTFEITSFKVTFDGDNIPYFEYNVKGNEFPEAVIGNIEKSGDGTKIMIEFIQASMADGTSGLLNPVNLLIKE